MSYDITYTGTYGTIEFGLSVNPDSELEHRLGKSEFGKWINHQLDTMTQAIASGFNSTLEQLVLVTDSAQDTAAFDEVAQVTGDDGTIVTVSIRLDMKARLPHASIVTMGWTFLDLAQGHVRVHINDQPLSEQEKNHQKAVDFMSFVFDGHRQTFVNRQNPFGFDPDLRAMRQEMYGDPADLEARRQHYLG